MEDLRNHEGSEFFTRSSAIVTSSSTRPTKLPLRQAVYFDIIDKYPKVPKARPSTSGNRQELRPLRKGRLELNYIPRQPSAGHQEGNNNIRPGFSFETYNISTKELRRLHLLNVRKGYMVYNIDPQDPLDQNRSLLDRQVQPTVELCSRGCGTIATPRLSVAPGGASEIDERCIKGVPIQGP